MSASSFGALCDGFYVNQKLTTKMELPLRRDGVLEMFERLRKEFPALERFKRYEEELALESAVRAGSQQWVALRKTSVRSGAVRPGGADEASNLHRAVLDLAPMYLSISPLDVESVEALYGFDLEAVGNHNEIVFDALFSKTPLARLVEGTEWSLVDFQPYLSVGLTQRCDVQASVEIKTRTGSREVRTSRFREEPISVFVTIRRGGSITDVRELPAIFAGIAEEAERIVTERVAPLVLAPLREAIASSNA
ncbi:MAG: hypothetical protein AB7G17_10755 [Phycisphaerales bacterium]